VSAVPTTAPRLPEGAAKRREVEAMFDRIAPGYDRMNRIISLGQDGRWRRRAVAALGLPRGARVIDIGCGTGDLCRALARVDYLPVGVDRSAAMLRGAGTDQALVRADADQLPLADASVDGVISGFVLRNVVDLDALFRACHRALRAGGRFVALETATPAGRVLRAGHALWANRAVPLLGRLLGGDADAYRYLPQSAAYLPPTGTLLDRLGAAGFVDVDRCTMTGGAVQLLTGTRA
jgi:demethylmenaquinone methyltransferase / 2-methoxy-6-polyprenyl-1,4-benzoquinol methylase